MRWHTLPTQLAMAPAKLAREQRATAMDGSPRLRSGPATGITAAWHAIRCAGQFFPARKSPAAANVLVDLKSSRVGAGNGLCAGVKRT